MFGFLRPTTWNREYRQAYARCCQFQHLHFGARSLPFLSYEAVLLYQHAADAGLISGPPAGTRTCCRLQTDHRSLRAQDAAVGQYCAAVGLLLAGIKLDDDVRDDGSWMARWIRWGLRKPLRRAGALFRSLDSRFEDHVDGYITQHLALEKTGEAVDLDRYAQPTAEAFGYVFGLMPANYGLESQRPLFNEVGRHVGAAIIAFDCAVDWNRDRRRSRFNPLPDLPATEDALTKSRYHLARAAEGCLTAFGGRSRSGWLLNSALERIPLQLPTITWKTRLQRWGLARDPRYVTARIDCCDCGLLECCTGVGAEGGAECCAAGNAADLGCCTCDGCFICPDVWLCGGTKERRERNQPKPES